MTVGWNTVLDTVNERVYIKLGVLCDTPTVRYRYSVRRGKLSGLLASKYSQYYNLVD